MVAIALSWLLLAGLYLALVGSPTPAEGAAAVLCGGLGSLWVRQIRRCGARSLRLTPAALRPVPTAFARLPGQTLSVGARLCRAAFRAGAAGRTRAVPASHIAEGLAFAADPVSACSRGVAVLAASLSPDAYVLHLEPERGQVLVHAFLPDAGEVA